MIGQPGRAADLYRQVALKTFIPQEAAMRFRHACASMLPNGRWWLHDRVEVWIEPDQASSINLDHLADLYTEGLLHCLAWRRVRQYQRGRWLGQERPVCDVGLIQCVHGLLKPTFELFCSRMTSKGRALLRRDVPQAAERPQDDASSSAIEVAESALRGFNP